MSSAPVVSPYGRTLEHPDTVEPPVPESIGDTGLSEEFIVDLLLKTLYVQGVRTGRQLTASVRLPFSFVDDRLLSLQQRRLVEVLGTGGPNRGSYLFDLTGAGRDRSRACTNLDRGSCFRSRCPPARGDRTTRVRSRRSTEGPGHGGCR